MGDKVVVGSACGEVRIEATVHNDEVRFRTYVLNTVEPAFNLNGQPANKLSISGICSYFLGIKEDLKKYLTKVMPSDKDHVISELVSDMVYNN